MSPEDLRDRLRCVRNHLRAAEFELREALDEAPTSSAETILEGALAYVREAQEAMY